jgi:D-alanyl-D-alanine carboxypeptidase
VTYNFNKLIGRFPGADGFKTGFICASGYNLVASATQNGKRLIAVVLGASSGTMRAVRAAQMLERGFANNTMSWLRPALGTVDGLAPIAAAPPNLRDEMCGSKRTHPASDEDNDVVANTSTTSAAVMSFFATGTQPPALRPVDMMAAAPAPSDPVVVYTGPTRTGAAIAAAAEADAARDAPPKAGKRSKTAHGKRDDNAAPEAKANEKSKNQVSVTINPNSTKPPANTKPAASKKPDAKRTGARPASAKPKTAEGKSKP